MCIKCILTPILFLIAAAVVIFLILGDVFAADIPTLDSVGTHNIYEFTGIVAERTSGHPMLRAFLWFTGIAAFSTIGWISYRQVRKPRE